MELMVEKYYPCPIHQKGLESLFINHIPKGASICKKDNLARHLRCMKKVYGSIFDFSPPGFNLPLEYAKLAAECSKGVIKRPKEDDSDNFENINENEQKIWICKPVGQSQGRGIYLFRRLSDLSCDTNSVVQRYIERPLLIGGYKFDLRLYVCIPSYRPLAVYLYKEGLARFGTDKFSLTDLQNPFRHLTNSSLNKFGPKYGECKERIGSGCKWTLRQVRRHLRSWCSSAKEWRVWQRISALVALTALAQAAGVPSAPNCFEFFGFDVLLDADLRPWLLEVNVSPALANDCDADETVKKPLLHDLFDLLGLPMRNTGLSLFVVQQESKSEDTDQSNSDEENSDFLKTLKGKIKDARMDQEEICIERKSSKIRMKTNRPISRNRNGERVSKSRERKRPVPSISLTFPGEDDNEKNRFENESFGKCGAIRKLEIHNKKYKTPEVKIWGNGRDWSIAPARVGGWIKLFPSDFSTESDGDVRAAVGLISKFTKAVRMIETKYPAQDDYKLNEELCKELQTNIQIWLPEK